MSRKIFKKVVFLLMFGAAVLGMYTLFSGINNSDIRSGTLEGLVNNMYIGNEGHKGQANPHNVHLGHPAPGRSKDVPRLGDFMALGDKKQYNNPNNGRDSGGVGLAIDFGNNEIHHNVEENERDERPVKLQNPEDIHVKDKGGNIIGQKLFAFGMSKNDILLHKDHIYRKDGNNEAASNHDDNENDQREVGVAADPEVDAVDVKVNEDDEGNEESVNREEDERDEEMEKFEDKPYYQKDDDQDGEQDIDTHENSNNKPPDVATRDHRGEVIGHKLFPFGIRPGQQANHEDFSSRKLQREVPHEEPLTGRQLKNIRPDAAFFDEKGNKKEGGDEMDRLTDFQQRMGLNNPLLRHKFDPNDPFKKHRALFRPLGAHGMNPALEDDDDDDDGKDPLDAFAGFDRKSVWGNRENDLFDIKAKPQKQEAQESDQNQAGGFPRHSLLGRDRGLAQGGRMQRPVPTAGSRFLNQNNGQFQRGQFMGHNNDNRFGNNINNRNIMPTQNYQNPNGANNRFMGALTNRQFPNQGIVNNNGQLMGYNNRPNQYAGQNRAWNNPIGQRNPQQPMGLNNYNNFNNRYPVNNNNPNVLQGNNVFGNANGNYYNGRNNLQNQYPNGLGQRPQLMGANILNRAGGQPVSNQMYPPMRGQLMGHMEDGRVVGGVFAGAGGAHPLGALPSRVPNLNPNQRLLGAVTPGQRRLEQQIIKPVANNEDDDDNDDRRPLPKINENVEVENTDEKEEELFIEDLTQSLAMNANCIPFPFPTGEASLCVPKMAEAVDETEMKTKLQETGTWEPKSLQQFDAILNADPSIGVIDIGAGVGVYTLAAALRGRSVVAVEPLFINYRLLHKSALANNVATKIVMVAQALDKESYIGHMAYSRSAGEFNKVKIEHLADEDLTKDPANNVHVTTLNQLVKAIPFKKALLKIDVGGVMEGDILNASSKFFQAIDIPYILTHWNNDLDLKKKIQIATKMATMRYKPKLHWDGPDLDPKSLHFAMDFLVWHKG